MAAARTLPEAEAGVYLEIETLPNKALPGLERDREGIRVANLRVSESGTDVGTVYVPDCAIQNLTTRLGSYGEQDTGNRRRQYVDEFEPVETIRPGSVASLWNGRGEPPSDGDRWWELWCFTDNADWVSRAVPSLDMDLHPEDLQFHDSKIVFARGSFAQIRRLMVDASGGLMEIKLAEDTPSDILEARELGAQQPWLDNLVERL